jgi:hypothetical protein
MKFPLTKAIQWCKDSSGKDYWYEQLIFVDNKVTWKKNINVLEGFTSIDGTKYKFKECAHDLQAGDDCYSADLAETETGEQMIYLFGNGWAKLGWLFWEEEFDYDSYESFQHAGHYLAITGKEAMRKFIEASNNNYCPSYERCIVNPQEELRTLEG